MSCVGEWKTIPNGLLKMKLTPKAFGRLKYDVQVLISNLAQTQGYKCAFCDANTNLEIEHEHYPDHNPHQSLDRYTIFNVRGLVCHWHNIQLLLYERDSKDLFCGLTEASSLLSDSDYESYIHQYECRVDQFYEEHLQTIVSNYWRRRVFLDKFDEWRYGWVREYPWRWEFSEIKDQKYGPIRTPKQFLDSLVACARFIEPHLRKNPEEIPEDILKLMFKIKPILDKLWPLIEPRYRELKTNECSTPATALAGG